MEDIDPIVIVVYFHSPSSGPNDIQWLTFFGPFDCIRHGELVNKFVFISKCRQYFSFDCITSSSDSHIGCTQPYGLIVEKVDFKP